MENSLTRRTGTGFAKSPTERAISGQGEEEEEVEEVAVGACYT
jgi:hypothetical protein